MLKQYWVRIFTRKEMEEVKKVLSNGFSSNPEEGFEIHKKFNEEKI